MNLAEKKEVANEKEEIPTFRKLSHLYHTVSIDEILMLSSEAVALLVYIRALRQMGKTCFASNGFLAKEFGCSGRKIQLAINELVDQKRLERRISGSNRLLIEIPVIRELAMRGDEQTFMGGEQIFVGGENSFTGGEQTFTGGVNNFSRGGEQTFTHKINIYNTKEIKKEEEGASPLVASLPSPSAHCVSEFSSPVFIPEEIKTLTQQTPFEAPPEQVTETNFGNLETLVDQLVAKKLAELPQKAENPPRYAKTFIAPIEQRPGAKMEPTEASLPVVSKRKAPASKKQKPEDISEQELKEYVITQIKTWKAAGLQISEKFNNKQARQAIMDFCLNREWLWRVKVKGSERPLTSRALNQILSQYEDQPLETFISEINQCVMANAQSPQWLIDKRKKGLPTQQKSFKQQDEDRAKEKLKAWIESEELSVKL